MYRTIYSYSMLLTQEHLSDDDKQELLEWQPSIHQTWTETQPAKPEEPEAAPFANMPAAPGFAAELAKPDWQTVNSVMRPLSGSVTAPRPAIGRQHAPRVDLCLRTLSPGSEGDDVKALQEFLAQIAAIYPEGKVTRRYGPATTRAVQRFQKKYNLAAEGAVGFGIVGPKTCQIMNSLSAAAR
jgi:hypothetical protein